MGRIFRSPKTTQERREGIAYAISNRDRARVNNLRTSYDDVARGRRGEKPWWRRKRKEQKNFRKKEKENMENRLREELTPYSKKEKYDSWDEFDINLWLEMLDSWMLEIEIWGDELRYQENEVWEDEVWEDEGHFFCPTSLH